MGVKTLTNPNGAFGSTDDETNNFQIVGEFLRSGSVAIVAGDAVALVHDASTGTLLVEPWDTNASGQTNSIGVGVALDAITDTHSGRVVLFGYAEVNVAGGTAAEGSLATGSTTKGVVTVTASTSAVDVGTALGHFLGAKNASNLAPIWVSLRFLRALS